MNRTLHIIVFRDATYTLWAETRREAWNRAVELSRLDRVIKREYPAQSLRHPARHTWMEVAIFAACLGFLAAWALPDFIAWYTGSAPITP